MTPGRVAYAESPTCRLGLAECARGVDRNIRVESLTYGRVMAGNAGADLEPRMPAKISFFAARSASMARVTPRVVKGVDR